jgi:lipopolysaccharide/colanic/teichoic acid biosynthesis glycosyltransferase
MRSIFYGETEFLNMLCQERKRTERSRRQFCLMLLNLEKFRQTERRQVAHKIKHLLESFTREVDIKGWYEPDSVAGVIFTETDRTRAEYMKHKLRQNMEKALKEKSDNVIISIHVFPDEERGKKADDALDLMLYPDLLRQNQRQAARLFKRIIDVAGSAVGLAVLAPFFLIISILVKISSKGPVFFRQERIGRYGKKFVFIKFRTMYADNDPSIHKKFVTDFICDRDGCHAQDGERKKIYKITRDPRVTPLGRVLRKASIDELPQLYNVMKGEMSLVGPRPPIPYEFDTYDVWHKRRVMEVKPGITGLWQVGGRSRTTFDEMVRLDIQYQKEWSIWMDIKILLKTHLVVMFAGGAY